MKQIKQHQRRSLLTIGLTLVALVFVIMGGTIAVNATNANAADAPSASAASSSAFGTLRHTVHQAEAPARKTVRVIQLFNTPDNPTGKSAETQVANQ